MGLRETFQKAAQTAFTAAGNVPESANLYAHGSVQYDVSSGTASTLTTRYMISMIFDEYTKSERTNDRIKPSDVKGLLPAANISHVPTSDDHIMRVEAGASVRYEIIDIGLDPAGALYEFQLRKG